MPIISAKNWENNASATIGRHWNLTFRAEHMAISCKKRSNWYIIWWIEIQPLAHSNLIHKGRLTIAGFITLYLAYKCLNPGIGISSKLCTQSQDINFKAVSLHKSSAHYILLTPSASPFPPSLKTKHHFINVGLQTSLFCILFFLWWRKWIMA